MDKSREEAMERFGDGFRKLVQVFRTPVNISADDIYEAARIIDAIRPDFYRIVALEEEKYDTEVSASITELQRAYMDGVIEGVIKGYKKAMAKYMEGGY